MTAIAGGGIRTNKYSSGTSHSNAVGGGTLTESFGTGGTGRVGGPDARMARRGFGESWGAFERNGLTYDWLTEPAALPPAASGAGTLASTGGGATLDLDFAADTITEGEPITPTGFCEIVGAGEASWSATGDLVASASVAAGDGEVTTPPATGTGALTAQDAIAAAAGLSSSTGEGTLGLGGAGLLLDLDFAADTITEGPALEPVNFATLVGTGTVAAPEATGTGALVAQASTLAGAGLSLSTGTAALTAGAATVTATGLSASTGTAALAAQAATLASAGLSSSAGTGALVAQSAAVAGAGLSSSAGIGVLAATAAAAAGSGVSASTGTAALAAQAATLAVAGATASAGTAVLTATNATLAGAAVSASVGTGTLTTGSATLAGVGISATVGTSELAAQASTLASVGLSSSTGTGALNAGAATIFGAEGVVPIIGTGALAAAEAQVAGTGLSASTGTGILAVSNAALAATALSATTGTGTLAADAATLSGAGTISTLVYLRPDGDITTSGWTDQMGATVNIVQSIDEVAANDNDYVKSPAVVGTEATLKVRLFDGATQIAEWTHIDIADEFADAVQTLTTPQYEAISDFSNLFVELDDNAGNVYRLTLGNPPASVAEPVRIRYRYKKLAA